MEICTYNLNKLKNLKLNRWNEDTLTLTIMMKSENDFKVIIGDIVCDKFILEFKMLLLYSM